ATGSLRRNAVSRKERFGPRAGLAVRSLRSSWCHFSKPFEIGALRWCLSRLLDLFGASVSGHGSAIDPRNRRASTRRDGEGLQKVEKGRAPRFTQTCLGDGCSARPMFGPFASCTVVWDIAGTSF